ncbi:MAG: CPBP family intramembrane metalloprotease [Phycisphaerales bacterium]|nr:CPBP family intramembrane metalloprotease [Phycisphaerales bacterium]
MTGPAGYLADEGYIKLSSTPLHILCFLAPLILLYEVGSAMYLAGPRPGAGGGAGAAGDGGGEGVHRTIEAHRLLSDFFEVFGLAGLFLPGIALVTVLIVWQVLLNQKWRVHLPVLVGMFVESAGWTLPLVVMGAIHLRAAAEMWPGGGGSHLAGALSQMQNGGAAGVGGGAGGEGGLETLTWQARLTISIGAGLYEEMLFRLVGITLLHFIFADLLRTPKNVADIISVAGAALAFALYHDTSLAGGGTNWPQFAFLLMAGGYLGTVYFIRGLGIVVATHALYDALVLVMLK